MVMWLTLGAFTYVERGIDLERARTQLGATVSTLADFNELARQTSAEAALREHDALLHIVTQSAAELLSTQHEDAVNIVLDMIGKTIGVSRVHLVRFRTDDAGVFRANIQNEWCAPGWRRGHQPVPDLRPRSRSSMPTSATRSDAGRRTFSATSNRRRPSCGRLRA